MRPFFLHRLCIFSKITVSPVTGQGDTVDIWNDLNARFSAEPTEEMLTQTLTDGLADGTIPLSDSDSDGSADEGNGVFAFTIMTHPGLMNHLDDVLAPVTSTPFIIRKNGTTKSRNVIGGKAIKVSIHDGIAMRVTSISPSDTHLDVLEKAATLMKRPNHMVEIGYEAPWSSKIGTKKNIAYISNEEELDDFWLAYDRYMKNQIKKRNRGEEIVCEIVFRNMLDNAQV